MISVDNYSYESYNTVRFDFGGTKDDSPPVGEYDGRVIANGSTYMDWSEGELYRYDEPSQTWQKFGGGDDNNGD